MTLIMECNDIPRLDESNEAIARRIRATPFNSVGLDKEAYDECSGEDIEENNYFIINPYYKTREFRETYKQVFFHILTDYFKIFKNNKFILNPMPDECKKMTIK
jgi:hypothetical protein